MSTSSFALNRVYGWKPDLRDDRDQDYLAVARATPIKAVVDLQPLMPFMYDQLALGSCTGNGWARNVQFRLKQQGIDFGVPSRLMIYYFERLLEGTIGSDDGAQIRDGAKALAKYGVCQETLWPYDITRFAVRPNAAALAAGKLDKALKYARVDNSIPENLMTALSNNDPVVFGTNLFEAFESEAVAATGMVPLPTKAERKKPIGGHCMVIVGYDSVKKLFKVANSWGAAWGVGGYCWFPFAYLCDLGLASDCWVLDLVGK